MDLTSATSPTSAEMAADIVAPVSPKDGGDKNLASEPLAAKEKKLGMFYNWLWPTSPTKSELAERMLLERGGLNFEDKSRVALKLVSLDSSSLKKINTLIVDQHGGLGEDCTADGGKDAPSPRERTNVVLCHGFGAGLGFWYRNMVSINKDIPNSRVYAIDWLGMGRSSRPPFPKYKPEIQPEDTSEAVNFFLDSFEEWRRRQNGLERFVLVGHSMGGYLAALYALRHPERVEKLVLASPVGLPERNENLPATVAVTGHSFPRWVGRLWNRNYTPQWIVRMMGPMGPRSVHGYVVRRFPYLDASEAADFSAYMYHTSAAPGSGEFALAALLAPGAWAREPLHSKMARLTMPTTFIYGAHDWMDFQHAEQAAGLMTVPSKIIRLPEAGHHLHIDNASGFNATIAKEVNALRPAPTREHTPS